MSLDIFLFENGGMGNRKGNRKRRIRRKGGLIRVFIFFTKNRGDSVKLLRKIFEYGPRIEEGTRIKSFLFSKDPDHKVQNFFTGSDPKLCRNISLFRSNTRVAPDTELAGYTAE